MHVAESAPYPWPWDGVGPEHWAMLVVQAPVAAPDGLLDRIESVASAAAAAGCLIVRLRLGEPRAQRHSAGEPGTSLATHAWNAFHETPLDSLLRRAERSALLLSGYWLEVGVHSTLRAANDLGYECATVSDLCASFDPALETAALSSIQMSGGIFGAVLTSDALLQALPTAFNEHIERTTR